MMNSNRREFLRQSGLFVLSAALIPEASAYSKPSERLRVGLIGCGGRGTGAATQALKAAPQVEIVALADIFPDRLQTALESLQQVGGARVQVPKNKQFIGFSAYKELLAEDIDVVLLCSPPNFRPDHMEAAVATGKHIFCEKPVAVDIPGLLRVAAAVQAAEAKKLSIVSGFCFRYAEPNRALFSRILQGDIGTIKSISSFRFGGELSTLAKQQQWSDLEFQLRNWFYFQRYSGDMLVEQAIHSVDMMSWALADRMPISVSATGGRQSRTAEILGNGYDHYALEYNYGDELKAYHFCRQQNGTDSRNTVDIAGSVGTAQLNITRNYEILGPQAWKYQGSIGNMYQNQHNELFQAVLSGQAKNDGPTMVHSTLLAIWGREAAYTGKVISYNQIMSSQKIYGPRSDQYSWDMDVDLLEVPRPGATAFL